MELRLDLLTENGSTRLTPQSIGRLARALAQPTPARLIALSGVPGSFCEGLDLDGMTGTGGSAAAFRADDLRHFAALLAAIECHPLPVVALVDGTVLGGGVGLAAAADLVLSTARSTYGLPETMLGLIPAVVFPAIARRMGVPRARQLALGARTLSAEAALEAGLVDEIVPDLDAALARYARRLERLEPTAAASIKRLVANFYGAPDGYFAAATARFDELLAGPAARTRLARFADGETPWPEQA
jgi:polyketide biosynthesis enoyl-CoA hydratase PksH